MIDQIDSFPPLVSADVAASTTDAEGQRAGVKVCSRCKVVKSAGAFGYRPPPIAHLLRSRCRECIAELGRIRYAADPERARAAVLRSARTYQDRVKARLGAWRARNTQHVKAYRRRTLSERGEEIRRRRREKYAADPESYRARCARYATENKDHILARAAAYREANRERINAAARVSQRRDQAKRTALQNLRHARQRGATIGDVKAIKAFYLYVANEPILACRWCRSNTAPRDRHVDHVMPLSKGGAHSIDNLVCACKRCNVRKSNKLPEEFVACL